MGDPEGLHRLTAGCGNLLEPPWLSVASFFKTSSHSFLFSLKTGPWVYCRTFGKHKKTPTSKKKKKVQHILSALFLGLRWPFPPFTSNLQEGPKYEHVPRASLTVMPWQEPGTSTPPSWNSACTCHVDPILYQQACKQPPTLNFGK